VRFAFSFLPSILKMVYTQQLQTVVAQSLMIFIVLIMCTMFWFLQAPGNELPKSSRFQSWYHACAGNMVLLTRQVDHFQAKAAVESILMSHPSPTKSNLSRLPPASLSFHLGFGGSNNGSIDG